MIFRHHHFNWKFPHPILILKFLRPMIIQNEFHGFTIVLRQNQFRAKSVSSHESHLEMRNPQ